MAKTEKQQAFLDALFGEARGDLYKAKKIAGYSRTTCMKEITGPIAEEITDLTRRYIATYGPKAMFSVADVMESPTDLGNKEKLAAAREFLDRSGLKGTDKVEIRAESPLFILPPKTNNDE